MKPSIKEKLKISARQIILGFVDAAAAPLTLSPRVYPYRPYKDIAESYFKWREVDRQHFARRIYYLKKRGLLVDIVRNKKHYLELTGQGHDKLIKLLPTGQMIVPKNWDKKWRVVIFDIPEKLHKNRDRLRDQLYGWGFISLQESIYVYPFECKQAIDILLGTQGIKKYVIYLIADIIQGEEEILNKFIEQGVLNKNHLK